MLPMLKTTVSPFRNTPSASSASVAELAIGHMFCLARFLHISNVTMRQGEWNKKAYTGVELGGKPWSDRIRTHRERNRETRSCAGDESVVYQ